MLTIERTWLYCASLQEAAVAYPPRHEPLQKSREVTQGSGVSHRGVMADLKLAKDLERVTEAVQACSRNEPGSNSKYVHNMQATRGSPLRAFQWLDLPRHYFECIRSNLVSWMTQRYCPNN